MIANALKAAEAGKKAPIKQELADLIKKMDEKSSVYACGLVKGKFDEFKLPGGNNIPIDLTRPHEAAAAQDRDRSPSPSRSATDVNVEVTLGMKDDDTAGEMRNALDDLIKQVKPLAALAGAAQPAGQAARRHPQHHQDLRRRTRTSPSPARSPAPTSAR